jgi:parallel beta-helix repeat protein
LTEPAIHFWNGSTGLVIEGNKISNSERGIYIGMGTETLCSGCTIRNNTVETVRDVSIGVENAPDTIIENNVCRTKNDYPNSIEYRWAKTTGVKITKNKTTGEIAARDGATASTVSKNTKID